MLMAKKGAVGIEQKVELGEKEVVHHVDLDHHYQENIVEVKSDEKNVDAVNPPVEVDNHVKAEQPKDEPMAEQAMDEPKAESITEGQNAKEEKDETEKPIKDEVKTETPKAHITVDHARYQPTEMIKPTFYLPGTEDAPRGSAAGGGFDYPLTNHFQYRNPESPTASTWGYFDFEDPKEEWRGKVRPIPDFESVPHRDVKNSDFPDGAWQRDDEYITQFLSEAKKLVNRTMEGIYAEYGVGVANGDLSKLTDEQLQNRELFAPMKIIQDINDDTEYNARGTGMWTTQDSLDGLARRILHAIITQDTFHIALGGHSAAGKLSFYSCIFQIRVRYILISTNGFVRAAGHGNGFNQSYIIQAGMVRLGIKSI